MVSSSSDYYGTILASVIVDRINVLFLRFKYEHVMFDRISDFEFKPTYVTYI